MRPPDDLLAREPVLPVPFTAFPNALLDEIMPTLKDTEWRVLCVIVRQTLGWSDSKGGRKERAWLSQRYLMTRTGRNSAAVSAAIDALIRRRLIDAWNEDGALLLTPSQRRSHTGKIYYGLYRRDEAHTTSAKTPLRKANTTKETEDKRKDLRRKKVWKKTNREQRNALESEKPCWRRYEGWTRASEIVTARDSA